MLARQALEHLIFSVISDNVALSDLVGNSNTASKYFYDLSATDICGQEVHFKKFRNKVVLIVNVASLSQQTEREYPALFELQSRYSKETFAILGFPCNQFNHQENLQNSDILDYLRYIKPGDNFTPNFDIFHTIDVNGKEKHPVFQFLCAHLPFPIDNPMPLMRDPGKIIWKPLERYDVSWNFEKFLISSDGSPYKRFSNCISPSDLGNDIEELIPKIC